MSSGGGEEEGEARSMFGGIGREGLRGAGEDIPRRKSVLCDTFAACCLSVPIRRVFEPRKGEHILTPASRI